MKRQMTLEAGGGREAAVAPATRSPAAVAACLKRQPLIPVCIKAVNTFRERQLSGAQVTFDAQIEEQLKLWIDASLLTEALVDLLEFAGTRAGDGNVLFSVVYDGINDFRLAIAWTLKDGECEADYDRSSVPGYHGSRTEAIVSQHRLAVDLSRDKRRITINLYAHRQY